MSLSGPVIKPFSGKATKKLVVFLHGYGADGANLIGLAHEWAQVLPDAEFIAPNAPFPCEAAPYGYQWFSLADRNETSLLFGIELIAPILIKYLDEQLTMRGLTHKDLALVGFSQGCMLALHIAPRMTGGPACVIGYSGALFGAEKLAKEAISHPPILLVHGIEDEVVAPSSLNNAVRALEANGFPVDAYMRPDLGHSIDMDGVILGRQFLKKYL